MYVVVIGILVSILLFKIYPFQDGNEVRKRIVQAVVSIGLLAGVVISFMFMKFFLGIILGIIGLFLAFQKRKKQLDGVLGVTSMFRKIVPPKDNIEDKKS